ncbi:MAG: DUF4430 domain-containing protein [Clostridiales bacterium]|nr:DUF4430 domain-containing protein [Clostridiales bacterium]
MKKTLAILLSLSLLISLCGCNGKTEGTTDTSAESLQISESLSESVSEKNTRSETESDTDDDKNEGVSEEEGTVTDRPTKNSTDKSSEKESSSQNRNSQKGETQKAGNQETTKKAKSEGKTSPSTTEKHNNPETTGKKSTITCYISIECKKIKDNIDRFSDDPSLVPSDGYILKRKSVTLASDSTVYNLLKTACATSGISVNEKNTMLGKYISGIAGIDEKECGTYSGWLYSVNGISPNKSVDKYVLSNNDEVVFSYTC